MSKREKLFVYALIVFIIVSFSFVAYSGIKDYNYKKAVNAENPSDKCKAPEGYTDKEWREHMGHHPDRYKECLGN